MSGHSAVSVEDTSETEAVLSSPSGLSHNHAPPGWSRDFLSSVVVFLVALPLCLGIAIASGVPPALGLISGIVGGIVVGLLAGAPLQVSGPAAGLVAIVYEIIVRHKLEGLGVILILAGIMQMVAGMFKAGQWFRAISPAVIQGMLAGIGVLIIASQFHVMLDVAPESNGLSNILSIPQTVMKGLFPMDNSTHHWAAMLGMISIAVVLGWKALPAKFQMVPGTLGAVLAAVVVAWILQLPVKYVVVPGQFAEALTFPSLHSLQLLKDPEIWVMAVTVAIVASAETMLSAAALDKMINHMPSLAHRAPKLDYDREMVAQGVGNTLCGFLGALPITGVIVRSSANVQAGAQTRLSAILHGLWILGLVSLFPFVLDKIPTACLAAILVYTGYKLIQPDSVKRLWRQGRGEVVIYAVTLVMVVCVNLLEGVIAGMILAVLKLLYTFSHLEGRTVEAESNRLELELKGSATFLSLPQLVKIIERQPLGRELHVHLDGLSHLDHACMDLLRNWETQYARSGGTLTIGWDAAYFKEGISKQDSSVPDTGSRLVIPRLRKPPES